jgi:hypothetical protein
VLEGPCVAVSADVISYKIFPRKARSDRGVQDLVAFSKRVSVNTLELSPDGKCARREFGCVDRVR